MIVGFFGKLGELIGPEIDVDIPPGVRTINELRNWLVEAYPHAAVELAAPRITAAIDDEMVSGSAPFGSARRCCRLSA